MDDVLEFHGYMLDVVFRYLYGNSSTNLMLSPGCKVKVSKEVQYLANDIFIEQLNSIKHRESCINLPYAEGREIFEIDSTLEDLNANTLASGS